MHPILLGRWTNSLIILAMFVVRVSDATARVSAVTQSNVATTKTTSTPTDTYSDVITSVTARITPENATTETTTVVAATPTDICTTMVLPNIPDSAPEKKYTYFDLGCRQTTKAEMNSSNSTNYFMILESSPSQCLSFCYSRNFTYSGLKNDSRCICYNSWNESRRLHSNSCAVSCDVDSAWTCGTGNVSYDMALLPARGFQLTPLPSATFPSLFFEGSLYLNRRIPTNFQIMSAPKLVSALAPCNGSYIPRHGWNRIIVADASPNCTFRQQMRAAQRHGALGLILLYPPNETLSLSWSRYQKDSNTTTGHDLVLPTMLLKYNEGQNLLAKMNDKVIISMKEGILPEKTPSIVCICADGSVRSNCSEVSENLINPWNPYHCLERGECSSTVERQFLSVSSNAPNDGNYSVEWHGWKSLSSISSFELRIYEMNSTDAFLKEGTLVHNFTSPGHFLLYRRGIYSAVLKVKNRAGYLSCARCLIVFDNSSLLGHARADKFTILSAVSVNKSRWIHVTEDETTIQIAWQDAFTAGQSQIKFQQHQSVVAYMCGEEVIPRKLDNTSPIKDWLAEIRFEFADAVVDDDGQSFNDNYTRDALRYDLVPWTNTSLQRRVKIKEGQTYIAALRAVDWLGRREQLVTRAFAASTGPLISDFKVKNLTVFATSNQVTSIEATVSFRVEDQWAGVQRGNWSLKMSNATGLTVILNESNFTVPPSLDCMRRSCRDAADCYCTETKSGQLRELGCFFSQMTLRVNATLSNRMDRILFDVRVENYASLYREERFLIWQRSATNGRICTEEICGTQPIVIFSISVLCILAIILVAAVFLKLRQVCTKREPTIDHHYSRASIAMSRPSSLVATQYATVIPKQKRITGKRSSTLPTEDKSFEAEGPYELPDR